MRKSLSTKRKTTSTPKKKSKLSCSPSLAPKLADFFAMHQKEVVRVVRKNKLPDEPSTSSVSTNSTINDLSMKYFFTTQELNKVSIKGCVFVLLAADTQEEDMLVSVIIMVNKSNVAVKRNWKHIKGHYLRFRSSAKIFLGRVIGSASK